MQEIEIEKPIAPDCLRITLQLAREIKEFARIIALRDAGIDQRASRRAPLPRIRAQRIQHRFAISSFLRIARANPHRAESKLVGRVSRTQSQRFSPFRFRFFIFVFGQCDRCHGRVIVRAGPTIFLDSSHRVLRRCNIVELYRRTDQRQLIIHRMWI